jgi:hypothetical protein
VGGHQKTIFWKVLVSLPSLLVISGCTQATFLDVQEPEPRASQAEPAPRQSENPEANSGPIACNQSIQEAIEETVRSQTRAFADNNYELAYSFASPSFRANVSLEGFVSIISGSYGPLIESSQLRFSDCLLSTNSGLALIDVSFLQSDKFVYALRYLMTDTQDGWRVDGASNLEVVGEGT